MLQAEEVILSEIRHAFAMKAVYDGEEQRWKAGQFMNIKADAPFYEAAFNTRLASKLI